jgi:hypothetical protein
MNPAGSQSYAWRPAPITPASAAQGSDWRQARVYFPGTRQSQYRFKTVAWWFA